MELVAKPPWLLEGRRRARGGGGARVFHQPPRRNFRDHSGRNLAWRSCSAVRGAGEPSVKPPLDGRTLHAFYRRLTMVQGLITTPGWEWAIWYGAAFSGVRKTIRTRQRQYSRRFVFISAGKEKRQWHSSILNNHAGATKARCLIDRQAGRHLGSQDWPKPGGGKTRGQTWRAAGAAASAASRYFTARDREIAAALGALIFARARPAGLSWPGCDSGC